MKKTTANGQPLQIKALVTANGNFLVNFKGVFFYMDPAGNHQPSKFEKNFPGQLLRSQEWAWLKGLVKQTVVLDENQVKLAEKVKNDLLEKNKPVINNIKHANKAFAGLENLAKK